MIINFNKMSMVSPTNMGAIFLWQVRCCFTAKSLCIYRYCFI